MKPGRLRYKNKFVNNVSETGSSLLRESYEARTVHYVGKMYTFLM
jgi:hypothetical protein